jgi:hypothetical protein
VYFLQAVALKGTELGLKIVVMQGYAGVAVECLQVALFEY